MSADQEQIGRSMRRGLSWNLAGAIITNGVRVVVIVILGRALSSTDFGIVAAAVSVNAVLISVRDVGVGLALVQRKELTREHLKTAFAISTYLGLAISLLLFLCAPVLAELYKVPQHTEVFQVLGLLFVMRGLSTSSRMFCQREMDFRFIAINEVVAFTLGSITSMALAVWGAGPWALIAGYLLEEAISTSWFIAVYPPAFAWRIDRTRLRELMTFGTGQTVAQIAGMIAIYGDNLVVGNVLGPTVLGYYTRAYDLIKFPSAVFAAVVGNVLFPAFSKLQDDRSRLAVHLRRVSFVNALVLLPASALLVVAAPEVIYILMGDGWDPAVLPFQILSVSILMRTGQKLTSVVASAANAINGVAVAYIVYAICVIGGAAFSVQWGITGVAVTTAFAITVSNIECSYLALRVTGLSLRELLGSHLPGLVIAIAVAGVSWPVVIACRNAQLSPALTLLGVTLLTLTLSLGMLAVGLRRARGDFGWLRDEVGRLRRHRSAP
jgi:O-antigen/teichoic acid export membrane protein